MPDKDLLAEFASFSEMLDRCGSKLSEEGIFVETATGEPVGSEVPFQVRIRDSFSILRGEGEVVRTTPDGVFLRFVYLDQPSLKLLPKLVEHSRRRGAAAFELPEVELGPVESEPDEESLVAEEAGSLDDIYGEAPSRVSAAEETPWVETADGVSAPELAEPERTATEDAPRVETGFGAVDDNERVRGETAYDELPAAPVPLTLDDLETEFLAAEMAVDPEIETESGVDSTPREDLPGQEPALPVVEEVVVPGEIRFEDLLSGPTTEDTLGVGAAGEEQDPEAGVPWLADRAEKRGRKGLWIVLLLVLLGALLGTAYYFLVLRPQGESGAAPPPESSRSAVMPAGLPTGEPAPVLSPPVETRPEVVVETMTGPEPALAAEPSESLPTLARSPLTGVDRITWQEQDDQTVVVLWADGSIRADQVDDFRVVDGSPREVVRIRGVSRAYRDQAVDVDTGHVRRLRTGLHEEDGGSVLHVVADLVDPDVELLRTEASGDQLRVYFSKSG